MSALTSIRAAMRSIAPLRNAWRWCRYGYLPRFQTSATPESVVKELAALLNRPSEDVLSALDGYRALESR